MSYFSTTDHNFGDVVFNSTHCIGIKYLGAGDLTAANFKATCGCTSVSYNGANKTLLVCLNMNAIPIKEANVICNVPEGQEIILLRGNTK